MSASDTWTTAFYFAAALFTVGFFLEGYSKNSKKARLWVYSSVFPIFIADAICSYMSEGSYSLQVRCLASAILGAASFVLVTLAANSFSRKENLLPESSDFKPYLNNVVNNIINNNAPTQVNISSPGSIQNLNIQRTIRRQARIEKTNQNGIFKLHLILDQTQGMWNEGLQFELTVKLSDRFDEAKIIQGFPSMTVNVRTVENKIDGVYFYSTVTAPLPNQSIVFEAKSTRNIDLVKFSVTPSE